MQNEVEVLKSIRENEKTTQRDIAKFTGMSLGNVNILIKRLVSQGLLRIEKISPRNTRYILTPEGLREKAHATYRYVVSSYHLLNKVNEKIDTLFDKHICKENKKIVLFGSKDEVYKILQNKLVQRRVQYTHFESLKELCQGSGKRGTGFKKGSTILVWHPDSIDILNQNEIQFLNLLDII